MNTFASFFTIGAFLLFVSLGTAQANDASGYCIEITDASGTALATLELARDQAVTIRGALGSADERTAKISDGNLAGNTSLLILAIDIGKANV